MKTPPAPTLTRHPDVTEHGTAPVDPATSVGGILVPDALSGTFTDALSGEFTDAPGGALTDAPSLPTHRAARLPMR